LGTQTPPHDNLCLELFQESTDEESQMNQDERRALWRAVANGDEGEVRAALAANPGLATEYEEFDYQPTMVMTMLHIAAAWDHIEIMGLLMRAGADPAALAPLGKGRITPLHSAGRGQGPAVKVLLDAGVDPNVCVKRGTTPLYSAAFNGRLEPCRLLLERGADCEGKPSTKIPLFAAAQEGHSAAIALLLAAGAKIDRRDSNHNTALHLAAQFGDVEVNRFLLEQGLDPDQANKKRETPRDLTRSNFFGNNRALLSELYDAWR
jgi:ankyrin repeat protein